MKSQEKPLLYLKSFKVSVECKDFCNYNDLGLNNEVILAWVHDHSKVKVTVIEPYIHIIQSLCNLKSCKTRGCPLQASQ